MPRRTQPIAVVAAALAAAGFGLCVPQSALAATADPSPGGFGRSSVVPAAGTFYPTPVTRLLGSGTAGYAVAAGQPVPVAVMGLGGLPSSGVSAVLVNLTATAGASDVRVGLTATATAPATAPAAATPSATPATPSANPTALVAVPAGATRSTLLTVPLGTATGFDVTSLGGGVTATADVVGFYAADDTVVSGRGLSGGYQPVDATRLYDSTGASLPAGGRALLTVDLGVQSNAHATALLLKVTSKDTTASGSLAVTTASVPLAAETPEAAGPAPTAGSGADPTASADPTAPTLTELPATVSFAGGTPSSNLALVPAEVDSNGRIPVAVTNLSAAPAGYAVDLVGFYDDGGLGPNLRFRPLPTTTVIDTASGRGGVGPLTRADPQRTTPEESVVGDSTFGLVGVLTASTTAASTVGLFPEDVSPEAADSRPIGAGTTSLAVQPEVGMGRGVGVLAGEGAAPIGLTLEVVGSFEAFPAVTNPAARRWVPPVAPWQISAVAR